jgi:hypothetical protein
MAAAKIAKTGFSQRFFGLRRMSILRDAPLDRAHTAGVQTQKRENNPMQSRMAPGSHPRRLRPGHEMVRHHGPT